MKSKNGRNSATHNGNGNGNGHKPSLTELPAGESKEMRPSKLLAAIEARSLWMRAASRQVLEAFFLGEPDGSPGSFKVDYYTGLKRRLRKGRQVTPEELERYAPQWAALLPQEPGVRAALLYLLIEKYGQVVESLPNTCQVVGRADPDVQAAYLDLYGLSIEESLNEAKIGQYEELKPGILIDSPPESEVAIEEALVGLEWLSLPDGAVLFEIGDAGDAVYVVISGRVRVELEPAGEEESPVLSELGQGEMIGLSEVMTGEPRDARALAVRDSELVRLGSAELLRLGEKYPQVLLRINRILAERYRRQIRLQQSPSGLPNRSPSLITIAIAPAGRQPAGQQTAAFARRLAAALETLGPVQHLSSAKVDEEFEPGFSQTPAESANNGRLAAWLTEQESRYRFVIYEANSEPDVWTSRCFRQADRILLVGRAGKDPELSEAEELMGSLPLTARAELVLIQPPGTVQPSGTRDWLERHTLQAHYHVRLEREEDLNRLVRRLTGQAAGLVLGGGGARGLAHIGVLHALREAGLEIDLIGGSSMGAIIGAAYAMGMDEQALAWVAREVSSPLKLFDLTLPLVSFFSGEKVSRVLHQMFGEIYIEDLWRPYFCMSRSLTRALPVRHKTGLLWKAVRASGAIPGIFSPVVLDGELLVDGAVLNNVPVDVMNEFSAGGPIVAVNVFPDVDLVKDYNFGTSVSGWQVLLDELNPFRKDVQAPLLFENLLRVVALNDVHQVRAKAQLADLYIRPPVERFNILDFRPYREIIDIGYRSAQEALREWRRRSIQEGTANGQLARALPPTPLGQLAQTLADLEAILED